MMLAGLLRACRCRGELSAARAEQRQLAPPARPSLAPASPPLNDWRPGPSLGSSELLYSKGRGIPGPGLRGRGKRGRGGRVGVRGREGPTHGQEREGRRTAWSALGS